MAGGWLEDGWSITITILEFTDLYAYQDFALKIK